MMFHKVKNIFPLPDYKLNVQFSEGVTKIYDVKPLFERIPAFSALKDNPQEFACVSVDVGGYGIVWGDDLDLSCDELWNNGNEAMPEYVKDFQDCLDSTGMMLNPGNPDKCLGNGKMRNIECRCDECNYLGECYPEHLRDLK